MINNRGGRKRELSIYSILTIIVLISISEVCASGDDKGMPISDDASLLVTVCEVKLPPEGGNKNKGMDEKRKREERISSCLVYNIEIDGKEKD